MSRLPVPAQGTVFSTLHSLIVLDCNLQTRPFPGLAPSYDQDPSTRAFVADVLISKVFSKNTDLRRPSAADAAIQLFLEMNQHAASVQDWIDPHPMLEYIINDIRMHLDRCFYPCGQPVITLASLQSRLDAGPGAVQGRRGYPFSREFYLPGFSFLEKVGYAPKLYGSRFLLEAHDEFVKGRSHMSTAFLRGDLLGGPPALADPASVTTVPKKAEIDRVIAVEPSGSMFYQKACAEIMEEILSSNFGIKLPIQQEVNRRMAAEGSLSGTFGTIDLTSASDTVSRWLVRQLLPRQVYNWLEIIGCRSARLPNKAVIELGMISTMGNACTFPLQTILFASVVRAVYRIMDIPFVNGATFGVNGDDIVVVSRAYDVVLSVLRSFGFLPNNSKSFNVGPFRESCGGDYLNGIDVRPCYIDSLKEPQDVYVAINSLVLWGIRHGFTLVNTLSYLLTMVPRRYVPLWEDSAAGIRISSVWLPRRYRSGDSFHYEALRPKAGVINIGLTEMDNELNPEAAWLAAMRGDIPGNKMTFRLPGEPSWHLVRVRSPNWDCMSNAIPRYRGMDPEQIRYGTSVLGVQS